MVRKGDEVEVHREQHQLDAHQQQQHVLALMKMPATLRLNRMPESSSTWTAGSLPALRVHLHHPDAIAARTATCFATSCTFWPGRRAHGERDRGDDRHQQDHRGHLERVQVLRVEQLAELGGVRIALRTGLPQDGVLRPSLRTQTTAAICPTTTSAITAPSGA